MKKITLIVVIFLMCLVGCTSVKEETAEQPSQVTPPLGIDSIYDMNWSSEFGYYEEDILFDEETAKAVAQQIFDSIKEKYGKEEYVVQYCYYYEKENAWMVYFDKPHKEGNLYRLGGGCTIALNKTDGRVMRIFWGE